MEKHLQVFSVLQWVVTFLAMGEEWGGGLCVLEDLLGAEPRPGPLHKVLAGR